MDSDIDVDNKIAKAIDDIPSNNVNENAYTKNMTTGKTQWVDSSDPVGKVNSRKGARNGARTGAALGLISVLDSIWSSLKVWVDANKDGISTGELLL